MGAVAIYALTGQIGVKKWRGSVLDSTLLPGRKAIPTYHPSYILKSRDHIAGHFVVYDLMRAKREAEYPGIHRTPRDFVLSPSFSEAKSFLAACRRESLVAYDIETRGLHLSHISFAINPSRAICIPFIHGARDVWSPDEEAELMLMIAELLEDSHVMKLGQNLSFDCTFMRRRFGIHVRPIQDTMIAAAILFPDYPKDLGFLTSIYCNGEPYYKDDGKEWKKGQAASEELFRRYNAMDSAVLMEIFPRQEEELKRVGNWGTYIKQKDLLHPLVYAGDRGIKMDRMQLKSAADQCRVRIKALEVELQSIMGTEISINSNQQLVHYFYVLKGHKAYTKRRKSGGSTSTVDEKALTRLASHGVKEAQLIIDIRKEQKMLSTYYEVKLDDDGRFRCSYNPVGTVQARISSSKTIWGTGSNLQNQTPSMLRAMIADSGGIYIVLDLCQAENRVVAYEACEMRMIDALENGLDIHSMTGCLIYGVPLDQCTRKIRQDGKTANHGLNFGFGVDNFVIHYNLDYKHGKMLWQRYHQIYPGVHEWHNAIREELATHNNTLINCYGRYRRFLDPWGPGLFQKAYDYKPQSAVATKMNEDGIKYLYYRQDLFPEVEFTNSVHDSVWFWVPLNVGYERLIQIISQVKAKLELPITIKGRSFSIPVDTKIGFNLDEDTMLEWKWNKTDFSNVSYLAEELQTYVEAA